MWRYDLTSVGREENQPGVEPAANCDSKELAAAGFCASWLIRECGTAVSSTEKTDGLGRMAARPVATASKLERAAGSVGRAVTPAMEALSGGVSNCNEKPQTDTIERPTERITQTSSLVVLPVSLQLHPEPPLR